MSFAYQSAVNIMWMLKVDNQVNKLLYTGMIMHISQTYTSHELYLSFEVYTQSWFIPSLNFQDIFGYQLLLGSLSFIISSKYALSLFFL